MKKRKKELKKQSNEEGSWTYYKASILKQCGTGDGIWLQRETNGSEHKVQKSIEMQTQCKGGHLLSGGKNAYSTSDVGTME